MSERIQDDVCIIRNRDSGKILYWNSCGWTDDRSTAQKMNKWEGRQKQIRMLNDKAGVKILLENWV